MVDVVVVVAVAVESGGDDPDTDDGTNGVLVRDDADDGGV